MTTPRPGTIADRKAGVLIGAAVGDALGVPYEFGHAPGPGEEPVMSGGGLGDYDPGEWSDDTQMACCITEAVADGADLTSDPTLTRIANRFLDWLDSPPADIGVQTSTVLRLARVDRLHLGGALVPADRFHGHALSYSMEHPHSAGNGALMRTGPVTLAGLNDRDYTARAARLIASLTHADPLAGDSCVLWCEAIRLAVTEERFAFAAGIDLLPASRRTQWNDWLNAALDPQALAGPVPGAQFAPNGFTVTALQAAVAAIAGTPVPAHDPTLHFAAAVKNAVRIGNDTDTVAAIAGALLGARWGRAAIPEEWVRAVHGWPGYTSRDLTRFARA